MTSLVIYNISIHDCNSTYMTDPNHNRSPLRTEKSAPELNPFKSSVINIINRVSVNIIKLGCCFISYIFSSKSLAAKIKQFVFIFTPFIPSGSE